MLRRTVPLTRWSPGFTRPPQSSTPFSTFWLLTPWNEQLQLSKNLMSSLPTQDTHAQRVSLPGLCMNGQCCPMSCMERHVRQNNSVQSHTCARHTARVLSEGVCIHDVPLARACSAALAARGGEAARKPRVRTQGGQRRIPEEPFVFDSEAQPIPVPWDNVPMKMAETRASVHRCSGSTREP